MFDDVVAFIKKLYGNEFIPLHEPRFVGSEKRYLEECIDTTFVSSVGKFVDLFEKKICEITGANFAVATMNGTSALHMALILNDVQRDDEVLTQALTFIATANAISYQGAHPVFLDSAENNLGLCPIDLKNFLDQNTELKNGKCINKKTGRTIKACVPMHVFGHPVLLDEIIEVCDSYNIRVIEDAAESLGSYYQGKHTGTIAPIGVLSFNGNKVVTSGGGGALLFKDEVLAKTAKHLTTTAKVPHQWDFYHDQLGYNYRMPNINAALLCAQLESLEKFLVNKRETAKLYRDFFDARSFTFVDEPENSKSNFWLNAVLCSDFNEREAFLKFTNESKVMTRPVWKLMNELPMYVKCQTTKLKNAQNYQDRVVNIPSSVRLPL